ncbi:lipid II:glycine glycyltransferase FemX [Patescibacteria group bacterium]
MAKYKTKEVTSKTIWEEFVLSRTPKSFLHSWNWGETNVLTGDSIKRLGFFKNDTLSGVCLMVFQKAKRGRHYLIPGGPILDWNNKDLVSHAFQSITDEAKISRAWFVRMRPELVYTPENLQLVRSLGFQKAPMHLHAENTWVLDISKGSEKILAGMRKNTRYDVRKSLKQGLKIEKSSDPADAKHLYKLQRATIERNKFVGFSKKLFQAQVQMFGGDDQAWLYLVKKSNKILVAAIVIFYGDYVYYHHSGSSNDARKTGASYFLQWKIIQDAKTRGIKFYDMWGATPKGSKKHRFEGPSLFKKGFGGYRVDWLPAHDLPISYLYWSTYLFERFRKIMRRL